MVAPVLFIGAGLLASHAAAYLIGRARAAGTTNRVMHDLATSQGATRVLHHYRDDVTPIDRTNVIRHWREDDNG